MKLNLKNLSKTFLTFLMVPGLAHSLTTQSLNESLCSNIVKKTSSPGFYTVHKPLTYKYEGTQYFLHKNNLFSINQSEGVKDNHFLIDEYAVDFFIKENSVWTLGHSLTERDLFTGQVINTYPTAPRKMDKRARAKGFHNLGDKIYIAHGHLGLVTFDLSVRKFVHVDGINTKNGRGQSSEAVSVSGDSPSQLFIAMSAWNKGFEGITVYNASSKKIVHKMAYDKRRSRNSCCSIYNVANEINRIL